MKIAKIVAIMVAAAMASTVAFSQDSNGRPNAPSSLSETYEDWTVACSKRNESRVCSTFQRQVQQNGQQVLGIELTPAADKSIKGSLVLPFGLDLDKGVAFAIDDTPPGKSSRFSTCLPSGCLVSLTFTDKGANALKSGKSLKLIAYAYGGGAEVPFTISLKGLASGLDRIAVLSK
ncbi:invasion associated locus B family protein [Agrobacterium vitis]|uniref:invasion associated locus B family protein n=1 Tax=Agrobacterium vitis TaxID=373 RepID=UPI001571CEE3|nr:invasion associated locus B family protein [Agrobacterium vitis]NSZ18514.1 invasion associated locus B family protein [Agrobacterium vitis]QZO06415.1 invasion associated locus B family protein [Agrobacterium vitis]UJL89867.1 invasion associated locus B family protein [Agrobacterium vitis]BCH61388.1 invasion protein [Agrobacterium vitis]